MPDFANMATGSNMSRGFGGPPGGTMGMGGPVSKVTNTDYLWTFASIITILSGIVFAYNFNKKW